MELVFLHVNHVQVNAKGSLEILGRSLIRVSFYPAESSEDAMLCACLRQFYTTKLCLLFQ